VNDVGIIFGTLFSFSLVYVVVRLIRGDKRSAGVKASLVYTVLYVILKIDR
jgi:hypothetical protein